MEVFRISESEEVFSNIKSVEFQSKYEAGHLLKTLKFLVEKKPSFYDDHCICILLNNGVNVTLWDLPHFSDRKKVFIIFDEIGRTPLELIENPLHAVFHAHLSFRESHRKYYNLHHYPLGCNSFVPEQPYVKIADRKINVFFSGNLHIGRKKLYQKLSHLHFIPLPLLTRFQNFLKIPFDNQFPNSYIRFTDGFSRGFSFEEYSNYLNNSKIILSPPGISNLECFRHYEGLRAGCVVIAERIPKKKQLTGSPIIEAGTWANAFNVINSLLKDPEKLDNLSRQSYSWYANHLASEPTAEHILESLEVTQKEKSRN